MEHLAHPEPTMTAASTDFRNPTNDTGAVIRWNDMQVIFGQWVGDEFIPAHHKPSRTYKTVAGARKAAEAWTNAERL
jgi:hypothetical protein